MRGTTGALSMARLPSPPRPAWIEVKAVGRVIALTALSSALVVAGGAWVRLMVAIAVAMLLLRLSMSKPALGIAVTLIYLTFMAMLRRMLLPTADWITADPMLLVGPLVAGVLIIKALVLDARRLAPDLASKGVVVILAITFLEAFNPSGGGVAAGISGLLFMAVPLLWFFVGREYLNGQAIERLLAVVVVLGTIVGCYGLWQLAIGDPSWDVAWLNTAGAKGYASLQVGGAIRSFGTFSSFGEYATYLAAALVTAVWFCFRRKFVAALPIPVLAVALFLASGRAPLIMAVFAIVVMVGMLSGRPSTTAIVTIVAVAAAFGALHFGKSALTSAGSGSSSAFVSHQLNGIANPLDPNSSTLLIHLTLAWAGIKSSFSHPLGQGTAVTNSAAGVISNVSLRNNGLGSSTAGLGNGSSGTDIDISNAFVALGPLGGILYLGLVVLILGLAIRAYFMGAPEMMPVTAVLIVSLGQWTDGGFYALSALVWLLGGAVAASRRQVKIKPITA